MRTITTQRRGLWLVGMLLASVLGVVSVACSPRGRAAGTRLHAAQHDGGEDQPEPVPGEAARPASSSTGSISSQSERRTCRPGRSTTASSEELNVQILGISANSPFSQKTFADSLKLPYPAPQRLPGSESDPAIHGTARPEGDGSPAGVLPHRPAGGHPRPVVRGSPGRLPQRAHPRESARNRWEALGHLHGQGVLANPAPPSPGGLVSRRLATHTWRRFRTPRAQSIDDRLIDELTEQFAELALPRPGLRLGHEDGDQLFLRIHPEQRAPAPPQVYSPAEPGALFKPSARRIAKPRPKP